MRLSARLFTFAATAFTLSVQPGTVRAEPLPPAPPIVESFDVGMLHVDRFGSGSRPLVLIPGLASGPWSWYGTIAHFAPANAIYAVTLAGFDGRPPSDAPPSLAGFASDFDRFLDQRKIVRPIVVGHSLGGTLALYLGEHDAKRFAGIVAVDGLPIFPSLAGATPDQRAALATRSADAFAKLDPSSELAYETKFMQTIGTADAGLVGPTAALEAKSDPKSVAAWLAIDLKSDLRPELATIATPLLEVVPYDAEPPAPYTLDQTLAFYRSLLAGAPDLRVEPIEGARHFAMLDRPQRFYAILDAFFATLKP